LLHARNLSLETAVDQVGQAGDLRRFYITARGSATECGALLDALAKLRLLEATEHRAGKELLVRIVSMLVKLAQSLEA
jgi:four helix bundle protein